MLEIIEVDLNETKINEAKRKIEENLTRKDGDGVEKEEKENKPDKEEKPDDKEELDEDADS